MLPLLLVPLGLVAWNAHQEDPERARRLAAQLGLVEPEPPAPPVDGAPRLSPEWIEASVTALRDRLGAASVTFDGKRYEVVRPRKPAPKTWRGSPVVVVGG
jgi:hypothetical protein